MARVSKDGHGRERGLMVRDARSLSSGRALRGPVGASHHEGLATFTWLQITPAAPAGSGPAPSRARLGCGQAAAAHGSSPAGDSSATDAS